MSLSSKSWVDEARIDWFNVLFLLLIHLGGLIGSGFYFYHHGWSWPIFFLAVLFYVISGLGITVGYHRLFAHQSFKAQPWVEAFFLFAGGIAVQNSALKWCYDHRLHHKFVDDVDDPYNAQRGFWYSHIGWILFSANPKDFPKYRKDLVSNPRVIFQHKYYLLLVALGSFGLPTLFGYFLGSALGGFVIAGLLRITLVHHFTFFINSLCHIWGSQPYSQRGSARDNAILALFTYGEGYHNFHHQFQNDYRNGIKWYQYDPSKWTIEMMSLFGWVDSLKKAPQLSIMRAQMENRRRLIHDRAKLADWRKDWTQKVEELSHRVELAYKNMREKKEIYKEKYAVFKAEKTERAQQELAMLKAEWQSAKIAYKMARRQWNTYSLALVNA